MNTCPIISDVITYAMWLLVLYMLSPLSSLDAVSLNSVLARAVLHQADKVAQKHDNCHLADSGNIDRRALLDIGSEVLQSLSVTIITIFGIRGCHPYLLAGKVDADSAFPDQVRRHLVAISRNTRNDHITDRQTLLETPSFQVRHIVFLLLQATSTAEALHTSDIDRVDLSTVVGKKSSKRTTNDLAAVDDSDATSEKTLAVVQEGVVHTEVFQDFDASQRCAGQDRLLQVVGRIKETDVLVHVADQLWRETFDILVHADGPLEGTIALGVEDGVVDDHSIDGIVGVGVPELVLEVLALDLTDGEVETVLPARLAGPLGVHTGSRILVGEEAMEVRLSVQGCEAVLNLLRQLFGNRRSQDDFT